MYFYQRFQGVFFTELGGFVFIREIGNTERINCITNEKKKDKRKARDKKINSNQKRQRGMKH